MSEILERRVVLSPYHLAQRYLADIIGTQAASPAPLTLTLSVPGAQLTKDVTVTYEAGVDPMHFDKPWQVHWKPTSGPYPDFDGELTVRADETYRTSQLELRGSYRPPGGVVGAAFDEVLGQHIAAATARALLERIAAELELRYAQDEKSKEPEPSS
jgi:hypothetical protein